MFKQKKDWELNKKRELEICTILDTKLEFLNRIWEDRNLEHKSDLLTLFEL